MSHTNMLFGPKQVAGVIKGAVETTAESFVRAAKASIKDVKEIFNAFNLPDISNKAKEAVVGVKSSFFTEEKFAVRPGKSSATEIYAAEINNQVSVAPRMGK